MIQPRPEEVFAVVADELGAVWLDGAGRGWSILAWRPEEVIDVGADWPSAGARLTRFARRGPLPFEGGCIGYVGYGAGHHVDHVPAQASTPEPEIWLGRYAGALLWHADHGWKVGGVVPDADRVLASARPLPSAGDPRARVLSTTRRPDYERAIGQILELVKAGDCYQVNMSRPVHLADPGPAFPAYRRLRAISAARFGAFLRLGPELAVLSNSPELLLEVRGRQVASEPIKGTRPRDDDPVEDEALRDELDRAPKDRAELTMIVDLVRNDLGKLAETGTVVTGPRTITSHANVHHAHQRIEATVPPGHGQAWNTLAALFPPGSVTGAPKVRACQRIGELESDPRGVYCGAIGYVADGGDACWSVAIRTAVFDGDRARYHVGGGIVAASDPVSEWWETWHKGRAMARAFVHGAE